MGTLKEQMGAFWDSVAEGWRHLRASTADTLTRFVPGATTNLPATCEVDDEHFLATRGWAILGGEMFEDDKRVVVRLELPGMDKQDIDIEISDDALVVAGEKRFAGESSEGRWRVMQCAYGSFRRVIALPCRVKDAEAHASYRNGILRIELPKLEPASPKGRRLKVQ